MTANPITGLSDNPAVIHSVCKIINSYNWPGVAYGFDNDFDFIKYRNPVLVDSHQELLLYYVRLFLSGATFETIKSLPEFKTSAALTHCSFDHLRKATAEFIDDKSRELISLIAKREILDGKDSSMILAHFLTIPELERFYGKLITYGFPCVILATCYMISELALLCFDYYTQVYIQCMRSESHKFAKDVNYYASR